MKTYQIETLLDLVEAAKETNDLDGLFADLRMWVDIALQTGDDLPDYLRHKGFIWTDDGRREATGVKIDLE